MTAEKVHASMTAAACWELTKRREEHIRTIESELKRMTFLVLSQSLDTTALMFTICHRDQVIQGLLKDDEAAINVAEAIQKVPRPWPTDGETFDDWQEAMRKEVNK